jgi:hypothetical protein
VKEWKTGAWFKRMGALPSHPAEQATRALWEVVDKRLGFASPPVETHGEVNPAADFSEILLGVRDDELEELLRKVETEITDRQADPGAQAYLCEALDALHKRDEPGSFRPKVKGRVLNAMIWFLGPFLRDKCKRKKLLMAAIPESLIISSVSHIAMANEVDLLREVCKIEKATTKDLQGELKVNAARGTFMQGCVESFAALLDLGVKPSHRYDTDEDGKRSKGDYRPTLLFDLVGTLKKKPGMNGPLTEKLLRARREIIRIAIERDPEALRMPVLEKKSNGSSGQVLESSPLLAAIEAQDLPLVEMMVAMGAKVQWELSERKEGGATIRKVPSVVRAAEVSTCAILKFLFEYSDGHGLTALTDKIMVALGESLAECAFLAADQGLDSEFGHDYSAKLEYGLGRGIKPIQYIGDNNILIKKLLLIRGDKEHPRKGEDTITVLTLMHRHGCNLTERVDAEDSKGAQLLSMVACSLSERIAVPAVADFCIDVLGNDVNHLCELPRLLASGAKMSPLSIAIERGWYQLALHLLARGALPWLPGLPTEHQPWFLLLDISHREADVLPLVKECLRRFPTLLEPANYEGQKGAKKVGPLSVAALTNRNALLDCLLSLSDPEVVKRAVNQVDCFPQPADKKLYAGTPLAWAAAKQNWDGCLALLAHEPQILEKAVLPAGFQRAIPLPSPYDFIKARYPDRHLLAVLEKVADKQRGANSSAMGSHAAGSGASNAFEDPSLRVLTEKEAKKKAKKKAAKKKAKAKKRERKAADGAAAAGAGENPGSEDDSSGTDEEEAGMDEEERMLARAPTFDLEKERQARKERAEREQAEQEKESR